MAIQATFGSRDDVEIRRSLLDRHGASPLAMTLGESVGHFAERERRFLVF